MAGNTEKLTIKVDVDERSAERKLDNLGREIDDLTEKVEIPIDVDADAATRAIAELTRQTSDLSTEIKGTASAMAAIRGNLDVEIDDTKLETFVIGLRDMGVEFDQIEAKAKEFADVIARADGVRLEGVQSGLTQVNTGLDRVREGGNQSRSVLANLAGNAAQDFGELGGAVGTLGVGLGQLAEYAVDGNIKLSQLAQVAGPMAGLAAATLLVTKGMEGAAKVKAFDAARVEAFTEAMQRGSTAAQSLYDTILETGKLEVSQGGIFGNFMGGVDDILPKLQELGISFAEFQRYATDPAALQGLIEYRESLDGVGDAAQRSDLLQVINGIISYSEAVADATERQEALNEFLDVTPEMVQQSAGAFRLARDNVAGNSAAWETLIRYLRDGGVATEEVADAMELLQEQTGLTTEQVWQEAQKGLDEWTESAKKADKEGLKRIEDGAESATEAFQGFGDAIAEAAQVMGSADWNTAGVEAAGDAAAEFFGSGLFANQNAISDTQEALDNLFASIDEHGPLWHDAEWLMDAEGREQLDLIQQLGQTYVPQIQQAFDDANGSQEQFNTNMAHTGQIIKQDLIRQFMELGDEYGEAEDKANDLMIKMGLIPENMSTLYELMGSADAQAKLALLQGAITALPKEVQLRIGAAVARGDFTGALAIATSYLAPGVRMPVGADVSGFYSDVGKLKSNMKNSPILIPVRLGTVSGGGGKVPGVGFRAVAPAAAAESTGFAAAGFATLAAEDESAPVAAPHVASSTVPLAAFAPTPVVASQPIIVNVRAGVIGDRFGVQRIVTRAVRNGIRTGGTRASGVGG